jgi:hypothetical protein
MKPPHTSMSGCNTTRTLSGPPSTTAAIALDAGGVADTTNVGDFAAYRHSRSS